MSIDYRIRCEYPKGQQDVLDAYLWLTSGLDEVEEVLGFQPTKILLCGDSAGAFLNFSLVHLLKDFNVEIQNENLLDKTLRYPDAIFNLYGFYNLTTISPAIMLSNIDFFLPPTNMRIAFGSLLNGEYTGCSCCNFFKLKLLKLPPKTPLYPCRRREAEVHEENLLSLLCGQEEALV